MRTRISLFVIVCLLVSVFVVTGVSAADELHVRVAHLSPRSPQVDVFVNGSKVVEALDYRAVSEYVVVPSAALQVMVVPAGGEMSASVTAAPIEIDLGAESGYFTLVAIGLLEDGSFEVIALPEDGMSMMMHMDMGMDMNAPMTMPEKASITVETISISGAYARATTDAPAGAMGGMDMGSAEAMPEGGMGDMNMGGAEATPEGGMAMGGMQMSMGDVSAIYMHIENMGDQADTLISVTTDVSDDAQIHQTTVDAAGVAKMEHLEGGLEIPAKGSVDLAPGGYHIMMMNLKHPLATGETVQVTLNFQSGVTISFAVPVMPITM